MADEEDLKKEIRELNDRIGQLENMIGTMMKPMKSMQSSTAKYVRLVNLAMEHGGLTPDMVYPEIKDSISKEIVNVLMKDNGQNISQIADNLREERGSASRRTVRNKLKELEDKGIVEKRGDGKVKKYYLTQKVLEKWSRLLGINI